MLGLAAAHASSAGPDWVARWIAIAGVVIAAVGWLTGWRLWNREGAVLAFDVTVTPRPAKSDEETGRAEFQIEVVNVGRMAATVRRIEVVSLEWHESRLFTDTSLGELPQVLAPTSFLIAEGSLPFPPRRPREPAFPDDHFASLIVDSIQRPEHPFEFRVQRGDGRWYTSPRQVTPSNL